MAREQHHEHQSLALLAGVAVDKGPEETPGEPSHTIELFHPSGTYSLSGPSTDHLSTQGPFNTVGERENVIQISSRSLPGGTVRLPIKLQMTHSSDIDDSLGENVVEVQYIIDPGGEFQVTSDDTSDVENLNNSKVILGTIAPESTQGNVLQLRQQRSPEIQVLSSDYSSEPQSVKADFEISDGNGIIAHEETATNTLTLMNGNSGNLQDSSQDKYTFCSRPISGITSTPSDTNYSSNSLKSCFLCQERVAAWKDVLDPDYQKLRLPHLLCRYMNISIVPSPNISCDHPLCVKCEEMLLRWHEVVSRYKDQILIERTMSSGLDISEDDNSRGEQAYSRTEDSVVPSAVDDKTTSGKGKPHKKAGAKKYRYSNLQNQIKSQIFTSAFHYLIKRDLKDVDWEYMAERMHTTKSNSSVKMKEIETMIFRRENLVSIFCDDCRKSISGGKEGYYDHRKVVHDNAPVDYTLPCDICGNFYPEKDSTGLSRNYFRHWIKHFYFEECQDCKEKFPNPSLLKKHVVAHKQRPGFPCPKCNKVLAKKTTLEQHIKTHLPEEEKKKNALTCHICGKMITAPTLKAHMFSVHSDLRPWRCEVCGANFKHKSDLSGHRNAVHLKIKNYNCSLCGKSFGHHCGLRVHMMKHENRREHGCSVCGKKFITQWHLKKHTVTHKEERDIICETCGKGFKKVESLQEHMTLHTGELPYECHICGRKVRVLSNLYKHFMVHKKNKTYYSKKDGLPDPLDAYIIEQQKRKQVNSIVEEAISTGQVTLPTPANKSPPAAAPDSTKHDPELLQVNRSATRVTYPASTSNPPSLPDAKKSVFLSPTPTTMSISSDVGVIIPPGGQPYRLPLVEESTLLECNTPIAMIHPSSSTNSTTTSPYLTYRIIDENGVEMETIHIPSIAN